MQKMIAAFLICTIPVVSPAQFSNILKRAQNKIVSKTNSRIDQKMDHGIDKTLDQIEGKGQAAPAENSTPQPVTEKANSPESASSPGVHSYVKFDFVQGDKVIYSNNFSGDAMGELPTGWNSNGTGAVTKLEGLEGNWVEFYKDAFYLIDNKKSFTENFTVEFDLLLRRSNPKEEFPLLGFGLLSAGADSTMESRTMKEYKKYFAAELKIKPYDYNGSHMHYQSFERYQATLETDVKKYGDLQKFFNKPVHVAMQVQKTRLRIWFNETKMYDLPQAIKGGVNINQLFFFVKGPGGKDEEVGFNVSNIRIATGIPDTRHKLIDEGKFSTSGILFAVNTADINVQSYGVIKEIATVLKENSNLKIRIVGHTDSEGSDDANLQLSKKRATAVKEKLVSEYGIDAGRIETDGKGESVPVADNNTREGRAQNRRVEFIKI